MENEHKKKKSKSKIKKGYIIAAMTAFIVGSYAFFFASSYIFTPSKDNLLLTELNKAVSIDSNHSITVENWIYSPEEHEMEIIISFDNTSVDASEKCTYYTMSRNQTKDVTEVEHEVTYESSTFANVMIYDVPEDFCEFGLYVAYESDSKDSSGTSNGEDDTETISTTVYTNVYEVETVDKIEPLSIVQVYIDKIEKSISDYEDEIEELENKIADAEESQDEILAKVEQLKSDKKYMTQTEAEKVESQISQYETSYKTYTENIYDYQDQINENRSEISTLQSKINELNSILNESEE